MKKKLLVRADDLGYSEGVNYGIYQSIINGIINNVGLMTNMESAKMGVDLLSEVDVCIGQHTNICVGKPLTSLDKIPSLINKNGEFKSSSVYRNTNEDFVDLDEVILEIEAQYQKFIEYVGYPPKYFEGHAVMSKNFFKGLEIVAKRHNLPYFKIDPMGTCSFKNKTFMVYLTHDFENYDPFDALKKSSMQDYPDSLNVFITHPGYIDEYLLQHSSLLKPRCAELEMLCSSETLKWIKDNDIQLMRYDDF